MNTQFILNNEPRKQRHLANVQSILACDSLVWLWRSDAEVPMPVSGQQDGQREIPRQTSGLLVLQRLAQHRDDDTHLCALRT